MAVVVLAATRSPYTGRRTTRGRRASLIGRHRGPRSSTRGQTTREPKSHRQPTRGRPTLGNTRPDPRSKRSSARRRTSRRRTIGNHTTHRTIIITIITWATGIRTRS